jgi:predicted  nucleic acid-binding Zn-ribbon protein
VLFRSHNNRLEEKRIQIKKVEEQIKASISELDGIEAKVASNRKNLISALARKIMAYQHANQKIRKTPAPDYFKTDLISMVEQMV